MNEEKKEDSKVEQKSIETEKSVQEESKNIQTTKVEATPEPKTETTKKKKSRLTASIVFILVAIIIGAILGAVYVFYFTKTEIDLSKYVSIEFTGYEGYASFTIEDLKIDEKGLKKALDDKKIANKLANKLLDKAEVKENQELKNGDTIEIKFKVSENWLKENKIKLVSDKIKLTVKDLEEPSSIDLFGDLDFVYSGISPDLTLSFKNNSKDDFLINKVTYTIEKEKSLATSYSLYDVANGDKITVKASYNQSDLEAAGYTVSEDEYTFTVSNQAAYISDSKEFTDEIQKTVESKLLEKAENVANNANYDITYAYHEDFADINNYNYNFTHTDPTLEKIYIAVNTDIKNTSWADSKNIIYAVYKSTFTDTITSKTYDYFIPVYVEDLVVENGKLYTDKTYYYDEYYSYNDSDVNHKAFDTTYKVFSDETKDNFTVTEIK